MSHITTSQTTAATRNPHFALKGDLTQGSVGRLLVRLTIPMVWGLLAMISFQLADMYFIARLGTQPLIAIGFTFPVTMFVLSLTIAMGIATSSLVARTIGEGRRDEARRLATQALMIAAGTGAVLSVAGIATIGPVFGAMGAGPDTLPLIRHFMTVLYIGAAFQAVQTVGNFIMRAEGDARSPALILTVAALVNLVLDPALIFGLFGLPRLEIQGAALANVLSYMVATFVSLFILAARKRSVTLAYLNANGLGDTARRFSAIAIPVGIANVIQPVANAVITGLLASAGPLSAGPASSHAAVAAFGIAARVEAFAFIIIMALASALGPIIGQNWGAKAFARVNATLKHAFAFAILWSLFVAVLLALFGRSIAGLFTTEPDVLHACLLYFWIVPASYAFGNLVNGWSSAFNAMGLPKNAFMLIVVRTLVLTLPLAWIGHRLAGTAGVFAGIALANVIAGAGGTLVCWRLARELEQETAIKAS